MINKNKYVQISYRKTSNHKKYMKKEKYTTITIKAYIFKL